MTKPILHFAHANSYPAGTYRVFFDHLRRYYQVEALGLHAHNPKFPVRSGWQELALELIEELTLRYEAPVMLAGHSMGGLLSLMAAKARPDLVRCVVLLDAPVVAGWRALLLGMSKLTGQDGHFSPARISVKRRNIWSDAEAAYQHFAAKKPFSSWPPAVLRDYVTHGLVPHPDGVTLRFTRENETAVYRGLPHDLGGLVRRPFPVPVGFVGGADSVECGMAGLKATKRLTGRHFRLIPGGHLFPMESPALAAQVTHEMLRALTECHSSMEKYDESLV
jgi:pimeloyl-ACP methyl ester carboxylesterase